MNILPRNRVYPTLLLSQNGLVKTFEFGEPKYVGDPINAIKIFNEKQVDELMLVNIDGGAASRVNFDLIEKISKQCRMPLSFGGGIRSLDEVRQLIALGVERVVFSSSVFNDESLVRNTVDLIGSQSVAVVLNYRIVSSLLGGNVREIYKERGRHKIASKFDSVVAKVEALEVGEIIFQCINKDGLKTGLDIDLIDHMYSKRQVPFSVLGGLSSKEEIEFVSSRFPHVGISAGSFFVFTGKFNSVLISYLD